MKYLRFLIIILILVFFTCDYFHNPFLEAYRNDAEEKVYVAGGKESITVGSVSFNIVYVPGKSFFLGINDDNGLATVNNAYWIGETEVIYNLWYPVRDWAENTASPVYTFDNSGDQGYNGGDGSAPGAQRNHPVVRVDWRDTMVWMNALTEYYNNMNGAGLICVYKEAGIPVRDSTNTVLCDGVIPDNNANGFRLLTGDEWELAARYITDSNNDGDITDAGEYYPGDHVSGDTTSYCSPTDGGTSTIFGNYCWYDDNCSYTTHNVKSKFTNALGLYDMCGNAREWVFDPQSTNRVNRGGSWYDSEIYTQLGRIADFGPSSIYLYLGVRLAKNP